MSERLCVVMPVYNEEAAIGAVLEKWAVELDRLGIDYVIRPYNDGSKDGSLAVMREVAAKHPRIDVRDKPNGGHGNTILAGYREAASDGFDWVFQIDSDDEMGPEKFRELWANRENRDFLVGIRDGRRQPLARKVISFVSRLCVRLFYGKGVWDVNTPYRLMRVASFRGFFSDIPLTTFAPNVILSGLAARHKLRLFEMRVPQHDRTTGEVSIKKWKLLKAATRSFMQTIGYAIRSGKMNLGRACFFALALYGVLFSAFLFLTPWRLSFACIVLAVLVMRKKQVVGMACGFADFVQAHSFLSVLLVLVVGMIERIVFASAYPDFVDQSFYVKYGGDWPYLWQNAMRVADGVWCASKSWTTSLLYGGLIRVVGPSFVAACVLNWALNFLCGLLLMKLACKWFGRIAGVVACALYFCHPGMALHSLNVATEHLYGVMVVLSLLGIDWMCHAKKSGAMMIRTLVVGSLIWLCVWTRGEGLLLFGVATVATIIIVGFCERRWRTVLGFALGMCFLWLSGSHFAMRINEKGDGARTILCSNDNLWPRLFGAGVEHGGMFNSEDKILIESLYRLDHPDSPLHPGTEALVPYIKAETVRRWKEMSLSAAICHIWRKQLTDWNWDAAAGHPIMVERIMSKVLIVPFSTVLAGGGLLLWLMYAIGLLRGEEKWCSRPFCCCMVPALILGNVVVLSIAECAPRYSYLFPLLFPILTGGVFWSWIAERRGR